MERGAGRSGVGCRGPLDGRATLCGAVEFFGVKGFVGSTESRPTDFAA